MTKSIPAWKLNYDKASSVFNDAITMLLSPAPVFPPYCACLFLCQKDQVFINITFLAKLSQNRTTATFVNLLLSDLKLDSFFSYRCFLESMLSMVVVTS